MTHRIPRRLELRDGRVLTWTELVRRQELCGPEYIDKDWRIDGRLVTETEGRKARGW